MGGSGGVTGAAGVNLLALRSHNTALVLDLLRTAGTDGISRLELAERTGLTPQAVSKITARLREEGLVAEAGYRASTGGKPRTVLRLVPGAGHALGVHLDRDELHVVLVDLNGTVVAERRAPLDLGSGADAVVAAVAREAEAVVGEAVAGLPDAAVTEVGGGLPDGAVTEVGGGVHDGGVIEVGSGVPCTAVTEVGSGVPDGAVIDVGVGVPDAGVTEFGAGAASAALTDVGAGVSDAATVGSGAEPAGGRLAGVRSLLGLGVALPGPLDHTRGVLHRVTGFPEWDGFPLRDALVRRLGVPVAVDKDTNAAALGLAVAGEGGEGGGGGSFAFLYLGTGLGAGLVIGGAVHRGARTGAGEFGHQVIQLDGPRCECGNRGCLETLCLGAVSRGEVEEAARVLGEGAANLVGLLDIDLVLLGGRTVTAAPEAFVRGVSAVLDARARGAGAVPVRIASGGVAEGAAQLLLAPLFGRGDG